MAITKATYSNGTLNITAANGTDNELKYSDSSTETDAASIAADALDGKYNGSVTTIDASKLGSKVGISVQLDGNATTYVGGKGADTVSGAGTITTGNGNDVVVLGGTQTITDYAGKTDSLQLASGMSTENMGVEFNAKNVILSWKDGDDVTASVTLTNAKDNLVNIIDAEGNNVFSQSFQNSDSEYIISNSNSGSVVTSDVDYIDGSGRTTVVKINATGEEAQVVGGTKNDTIVAQNINQTLTGGKGVDTFVIGAAAFTGSSDTVVIADYTVGTDKTADRIVLDGINIVSTAYSSIENPNGYTIDSANNAVIFTAVSADDTTKAIIGKIQVNGGLWNQLKPAAKAANIVFGDTSGATVSPTAAYSDFQTVVVSALTSKKENIFDFSDEASVPATIGSVTVTTDTKTVDFSNISNAIEATIGSNLREIIGSKGKDTLFGDQSAGIKTVIANPTVGSSTSTAATTATFTFVISATSDLVYTVYANLDNGEKDKFTIYLSVSGSGLNNGTSVYTVEKIDFEKYTYELGFKAGDTLAPAAGTGMTDYLVENIIPSDKKVEYSDSIALDGGKGNDYLSGNNVNLIGGDGNDTFRAASSGGATMQGGAGNDVFLITAEATTSSDTSNANVITDYSSGKVAATKKAYGTDKITVAYDKYNAKNVVGSAQRASITGSSIDDNGNLTITVSGRSWVNNDATINGKAATVGSFTSDAKSSTYTFSNMTNGSSIVITEQGRSYDQIVGSTDGATVTGNWLGYLDPNATFISAADTKNKAQYIDVNGTTSTENVITVVGSAKNDTIIGNGQSSLTGGAGNDYFFVQNNDIVADYSNSSGKNSNGKDIIVVDDITNLADVTTDDEGNIVVTSGTFGTAYAAENATPNSVTNTFSVNLEDGTTYTAKVVDGIITIFDEYNNTVTVTNDTFTAENSEGNGTTYTISKNDDGSYNITYQVAGDTGSFTLEEAAGTAITFNSFDTQFSTSAKGVISEKSVKSTMVRTFGTGASDSIVTFKASDGDYLKVFASESDVRTINAKSGKALTLVNEATGVDSIVGTAKADIIHTGKISQYATNENDEVTSDLISGGVITMQSGNGNDVIIAEGNLVITDFTGAAINNKGKITKGDALVVDAGSLTDKITWDGSDVIITDDNDNTIRLVNAKDSTGLIMTKTQYDAGFDITGTVGAADNVTVSLANPNEYLITKAVNKYDATNVTSTINIVNGSAATKALNIEFGDNGSNVSLVSAGSGADTVTALVGVKAIDAGKGNDIIDLRQSTEDAVNVTTGAGNDVIQISGDTKAVITDYTAGGDKIFFGEGYTGAVNSNYITSVVGTKNGNKLVTGSGKSKATVDAYDFTFTLNDGSYITLKDQLAGAKTTVILDTVTSAKANTFALDYVTKGTISIGNSDGATIDLKGVNASTIDLEQKRTKAITFINTGSSKIVQATGSKSGAAVTFIGNVASSESGYIEKNATVDEGTISLEEEKTVYALALTSGDVISITIATTTDDDDNEIVSISSIKYNGSEVTDIVNGAYHIGDNYYTFSVDDTEISYVAKDTAGPSTEGYEEAIYIGGAKTDVYIGGGYADTVNLGAGNDTVGQKDGATANKATIQLGSGKDVAIVNAGDNYTIEDYKAGDDKFIIDSALSIQDATVEDGVLTINFSKDDTENAAIVKLTGYSGDKVTIAQFGANAKGKVTTDSILQQSFGQEKITIVDADAAANATISTSLDSSSEKTTTIDASATKKAHVLVGDGNVNSIIGGAGNDTIEIINAGSYTGGKGVDVFQINLSGSEASEEEEEETTTETPTVTITDFNTGNDILDISGLSLADYDTNYTLGASDATITTDSANIVLKDVVKNGVTSAIRYSSDDTSTTKSGVTLSDKTNIVLTAKATKNDFSDSQFTNNTLTINASKSTVASALQFNAGANFTDYTAGKGGSAVDLSPSTKKVNVVTGAGEDNIVLGSAGANVTVGGGGDDAISGVTSNASFALAKGWTISEVDGFDDLSVDGEGEGTANGSTSRKLSSVTFTLKKGSATQSVTLSGEEGAELFTLTKAVATGSANKQNKATETTTLTLSGLGLSYSTTSKSSVTVPTDSAYREAGFAELVSDDNFASASDLDNITAVKADDAAVAVDYADLTSINNSTDFTQVTTAATKKQNK